MKKLTGTIQLSIIVFFAWLLAGCTYKPYTEVDTVAIDFVQDPMGVDPSGFHFSWTAISNQAAVKQTAFRILLTNYRDEAYNDNVWDSGKTESDRSILVPYSGPDLLPGARYRWKVRIWDNYGVESHWSQEGTFITGLPGTDDWEGAQWISFAEMDDSERILPGVHWPPWPPSNMYMMDVVSGEHDLPLYRRSFEVEKNVEEAIIFVSGLGQYELSINGKKVGNSFLAPGWTRYDQYALYNVYEVTGMISQGVNAIGLMMGNGFLNIPTSRYRKLNIAYDYPKAILKLVIRYTDGSSKTIITDSKWKWDRSPLTYSNIYGGENYNATLEQPGWNEPGFDDSDWKEVVILSEDSLYLEAERDYPVKVMNRLSVVQISKIDGRNDYLYDFGQNASGVIEVKVRGNRGDTIKFIPSELLYDNGTADQGATGSPYYYIYVLKGDEEETWSPRFTYYGFRYVQVEGAVPVDVEPGTELPEIVNMEFLHTRNSAPELGYFHTSFDLFNRINQLIKWAIRSNFQSVITDCPTREKLGWLEQTYLMGGGIHFNYDVYQMYKRLVEGMMHDQIDNGMIPSITPEYVEFWEEFRDLSEWGSAAVILPWLIYRWYGDSIPITESWDMMIRYVDYLESRSDDHIITYGFSDWYDLGQEPPGYSQQTPQGITATAIFYYDVKIIAEMAGILDREDDRKMYSEMAEEIRLAFNKRFYDPVTKVYSSGSQTSMAMPLVLGIVEENDRDAVIKNLVDSIKANDYRLTAGDIGFHFLVRALMDEGRSDILFKMNNRDDVPGYGYQLKKGATTLTESWDALDSKSNNHLMLGHIMEWFYGGLAGISQTDSSCAYREILINPAYLAEVDTVECRYYSPYGSIISEILHYPEGWMVKVKVPENTTALVWLPSANMEKIYESGSILEDHALIKVIKSTENKTLVSIGSGHYIFSVYTDKGSG